MVDQAKIEKSVEAIFGTGTQAAFVVAGAGSLAMRWLLQVAGASETVLEIEVPYSAAAMQDYAGWLPQKFVSPINAQAMAAAAYVRAQGFRNDAAPVLGLGCSATIATKRVKRGQHGAAVCVRGSDGITTYFLEIKKGLRDRHGEEELVSLLILQALLKHLKLPANFELELDPEEHLAVTSYAPKSPLDDLFASKIARLACYTPDAMVPDLPFEGLVLSGSFNVAHEGHLLLAQTVRHKLKRPVAFELSIDNVDKESLDKATVIQRLAQPKLQGQRVLLSRAPLFHDKAALFTNSVFIVGYDTASRLVDPKYYGNSAGKMLAAFEEIRRYGCSFLVAGRKTDGKFYTLKDLVLPEVVRDLFQGLTEDEFRLDLSSTEIRNQS